MLRTIGEIKAANKAGGWYFFSRDTMRFFRSTAYAGVYPLPALEFTLFITSERFDADRPEFTIRIADWRTGDVDTLCGELHTLGEARQICRWLKKGSIHGGRK